MPKNQSQVSVAGLVQASNTNPLGIGNITLDQISNMPLAQYQQLAGNFVNVQNAVYYDTAVFTAGTAITSGMPKRLFTKGKNQDDTVVNTGVAIPEKGEFLTNMISD